MFNGTWKIDTAASDSPEPLLQAQGIGWAKRKLLLGGQRLMTVIISMDDEVMTIDITSPIKNQREELKLDGTVLKKLDDILGQGEVEITATWEDENHQAIIQTIKGLDSMNVSRRYMKDDNTMVIDVTWSSNDGSQEIKLKRVFVRAPQ